MAGSARDLGQRIKEARRREKLTLAELSERSGVAISTLSKIENGQTTGSVDTLFKIARGLRVLFDTLVDPPAAVPDARWVVTRAAETERFSTEQYDYDVHAAGLVSKRMLPLAMTVKARRPPAPEDWSTHPGEEYALVLEGAVELHTEHYAPVLLEAGDSAYFDSRMRHCYVAPGGSPARIISICLAANPGSRASVRMVRKSSGAQAVSQSFVGEEET